MAHMDQIGDFVGSIVSYPISASINVPKNRSQNVPDLLYFVSIGQHFSTNLTPVGSSFPYVEGLRIG